MGPNEDAAEFSIWAINCNTFFSSCLFMLLISHTASPLILGNDLSIMTAECLAIIGAKRRGLSRHF